MSFYNSFKNYLRSSCPDYYAKLDSKKVYIKYVIGGGTAAFVDLFLLYVLTDIFHLWYLYSAGLAFLAAFLVSFYLQKFWTFRDNSNKKIHKQMAAYFAVGAVNLGVNTGGIYLLVEKFNFDYLWAQIIMGALIAVGSFLIYRFVIFKEDKIETGSRVKVLVATGIFPPDIGGPATYSKLLADELPKRGVEVEVLSFGSVRHLPKIIRHFVYFFKVLKTGRKVDVIYAQDPVSVGLPAMFATKLLRKRFILKVVGDYAWEQGVQRFKVKDHLDVFSKKNDEYLVPVLLLKKLQKIVAKYAEKVIVPSKYFKGIIENWGVNSNSIKVIYSVAEDIPFQGRKADLRRMLQFDGKIVASAGRLVPWKGFEALIEITPRLIKRYSSFKFLIAGDGPGMKKLSKMVRSRKLDDYIALTGNLERDVLFKYVRVADVFVLNTNYEGLSHQLLEVMSIGTPIITTNVGGNPELIDDDKNGLLVQFNNKDELYKSIISVLDDKSKSERLVRNAKNKLEKFNTENMIKELVKEFNSL